jgi:hypothetical protein
MEGVPAGRYVLHIWHRHLQDPGQSVVVSDGEVTRTNLTLTAAPRPRSGAFPVTGR